MAADGHAVSAFRVARKKLGRVVVYVDLKRLAACPPGSAAFVILARALVLSLSAPRGFGEK